MPDFQSFTTWEVFFFKETNLPKLQNFERYGINGQPDKAKALHTNIYLIMQSVNTKKRLF